MRYAALILAALGFAVALAASSGGGSGGSQRSRVPTSFRAAVDRPVFDTPATASRLLPATSLVAGLERAGEWRAYPMELLSLHGVVDDVVGDLPVAVVLDPFAGTVAAFERTLGSHDLTFSVAGAIVGASRVLTDRETGSFWNLLLARGVTRTGMFLTLQRVPIVVETWAQWRSQHPQTSVLSISRDAFASRFTHPYEYSDVRGENASYDPYQGWVTKVQLRFPERVGGLADNTRVLGIVVAGMAMAYPDALLVRRGAIDDIVASRPILVTYDSDAVWASAFSRRVDRRTLTFRFVKGKLIDRETGSTWSPTSGRALSGPEAGRILVRLPSVFPYWLAWRAAYPASSIYRGS